MKRVPIYGVEGVVAIALVDDEDYDEIVASRWNLRSRIDRYAVRRLSAGPDGHRPQQAMHRQVLGLEPGEPLHGHHLNRDTLDNRRSNLVALSPFAHAATRRRAA